MNRREAIQRAGLVLGYAISAPTMMAVLNGCKARPDLAFKPVFFSEDQARLISDVSEIIIPKTDTPGAKDVGVPGFIDLILKDCYKEADQARFIAGLEEFDKGAREAFGDKFVGLEPGQQLEYLKKVHDQAVEQTKSGELKERPFILTAKELILVGFFTSEPGATQVLQYAPVPGAYHGCQPLAEVGKTWAT